MGVEPKKASPNPTDQAKKRVKRSLLTEASGVPVGVAIDGANRHDIKLVEATVASVPVERTAPTAMLLFSLIVIWFARGGHQHLTFPNRPWYRTKRQPSFADTLTTLRRECLRETFLQTPAWDEGFRKTFQSLVDLCSRAA